MNRRGFAQKFYSMNLLFWLGIRPRSWDSDSFTHVLGRQHEFTDQDIHQLYSSQSSPYCFFLLRCLVNIPLWFDNVWKQTKIRPYYKHFFNIKRVQMGLWKRFFDTLELDYSVFIRIAHFQKEGLLSIEFECKYS